MATQFEDRSIVVHPRPKKSLLPPPSKKRRTNPAIEEISFDFSAREDYLTGFHKRKVARAKQAQDEAKVKEREERIVTRKQVRHFCDWERAGGLLRGLFGVRSRGLEGDEPCA